MVADEQRVLPWPLVGLTLARVGDADFGKKEGPVVANRQTLTRLSWTLVVLVVISAAVTLLLTSGVLHTQFDIPDLVDRLIAIRTDDERVFPLVMIGSLATVGVYLVAAMLGVVLRAWTAPSSTRDVMTVLLVFGGLIGMTSQLANIGVGDAARPFYCDCGYRTEQMIGRDEALNLGWSMVNWLAIGAITLVGVGVAVAGSVVSVTATWRVLSYAIAVGVLLAAAVRVAASIVFIEAFDPFQVSDLIIAITSGILVPVWAILLSRGVVEPEVEPTASPAF